MHRTLCVMAFALCAGLANSFSWDIVVSHGKRLTFIDNVGTQTNTETLPLDSSIRCLTYDPVHNRVLIADFKNIYSFDIATKETKYLTRYANGTGDLYGLVYDPATMLLFWNWIGNVFTISLNPRTNDKAEHHQYIKNRLLFKDEKIQNFAIDSCGGFIYWNHYSRIKRARFDGSGIEVVINTGQYIEALIIDQHSQKLYWYDKTGSITSADLNGKNIRTIIQYSSKSSTPYLNNIKHMAASKDFIYFRYKNMENEKFNIIQILKNSPDMEPKNLIQVDYHLRAIAAKYNIEGITQENENCDTLKSLPYNYSD